MSGFDSGDEPVNKLICLSLDDERTLGQNGNQAKASFPFRSTEKAADKSEKRTSFRLATYKLSANPRGYCLIININEFSSADLDRRGSDEESKRLGALFEKMRFQVMFPHRFLPENETEESPVKMTARKIHEVLDIVRQDKALEAHDAFILFIMSHGTSGKVKGYDGYSVYVDEIIQYFTDDSCPNLAGKPKLFFIEACRGENFNRSKSTKLRRPVKADSGINCSGGVNIDKSEASLSTASAQDMAIVYSTLDGCTALRDEVAGSWFGVAIEEVFKKYAEKSELNDLVRKVNEKVSKRSKVHKQVLEWHYKGFGKKFIFGPFREEDK